MAYYDALITKWGTLTPGTTAAKLAQVNALTVQTAGQGIASVTPSQVINAIVWADLKALTQLQLSQINLLIQGGVVDASKNSTIRNGLQDIFSGKTTTLNQLLALVVPADAPVTIPWWQATVAQGGGELRGPVAMSDLAAAGGLT